MISHRWQPLSSSIQGVDFDFHEVDSLNEQWLTAKKRAEDSNPNAYREFMDQLTRSWVIETGIIEGLYTLDRGVTETLVTEGIAAEPHRTKLYQYRASKAGCNSEVSPRHY